MHSDKNDDAKDAPQSLAAVSKNSSVNTTESLKSNSTSAKNTTV